MKAPAGSAANQVLQHCAAMFSCTRLDLCGCKHQAESARLARLLARQKVGREIQRCCLLYCVFHQRWQRRRLSWFWSKAETLGGSSDAGSQCVAANVMCLAAAYHLLVEGIEALQNSEATSSAGSAGQYSGNRTLPFYWILGTRYAFSGPSAQVSCAEYTRAAAAATTQQPG